MAELASTNIYGQLNVLGDITSSGKISGVVYNDYAEYRQSKEHIGPGHVVCEVDGKYVALSRKRLSKAPMVVSDVFGFSIGRQSVAGEYSLPVAVAGRVLVYTDKPREKFKVGDVVCAGKNGTASKMRWWEKILFPDRILGIVSEIPDYNTWGNDNVKVNGRIWIKIY